MSEFEVLHVAVGGIMLTALFVTAVIMSGLAFGSSTNVHIEDLDKISVRSALHLAEHCLKNDKEYVDIYFLNKTMIESISSKVEDSVEGLEIKQFTLTRSDETVDILEKLDEGEHTVEIDYSIQKPYNVVFTIDYPEKDFEYELKVHDIENEWSLITGRASKQVTERRELRIGAEYDTLELTACICPSVVLKL